MSIIPEESSIVSSYISTRDLSRDLMSAWKDIYEEIHLISRDSIVYRLPNSGMLAKIKSRKCRNLEGISSIREVHIVYYEVIVRLFLFSVKV